MHYINVLCKIAKLYFTKDFKVLFDIRTIWVNCENWVSITIDFSLLAIEKFLKILLHFSFSFTCLTTCKHNLNALWYFDRISTEVFTSYSLVRSLYSHMHLKLFESWRGVKRTNKNIWKLPLALIFQKKSMCWVDELKGDREAQTTV